jgi:ATP-dependent DNA helicase RecQ
LFERLREWRREAAAKRGVPPFIIFQDNVLQHLSIVRPTRLETMRLVRGIGERRLEDHGPELIAIIGAYCREHGLSSDIAPTRPESPDAPRPHSLLPPLVARAFALFEEGRDIEHVAQAIGRARSTTFGYLADYIAKRRPERIDAWVDEPTYRRVATVAATSEDGRLKPLFEQLGGEVPYDTLRLVVAHLQATARP